MVAARFRHLFSRLSRSRQFPDERARANFSHDPCDEWPGAPRVALTCTNFHTTALCSGARSGLMTGGNHPGRCALALHRRCGGWLDPGHQSPGVGDVRSGTSGQAGRMSGVR